ncbi:ribosomal protein S7p/S5e [Ceratobasidium sp. AG-Ba]|nr:ribosomal protein S7p/S5e [Ceratobasidium sp. AG-Ba]QRW10760.1 ribosomal protein S7p/S5e [Ceratobasidium sp. AG-Ba]
MSGSSLLRLASRSLGARKLHGSAALGAEATKGSLPAGNSAASPVLPPTATSHTSSSFAQRFAAAKYDKPPVTPFLNPDSLLPTPLPAGTQLPATADPLLDFTAALLQKHGERTKAERTVTNILQHIHILTGGAPALPIFREAVRLVSPSVKVVTQKRRAKNLPTPRPLTERARTRAGILAILKASEKRPERNVSQRVGRECINVLRGESDAIKKLEEVHRFALANRANASIRV